MITKTFINVKGVFNHISKVDLFKKMLALGTNGDLIGWTKSFLTNRKVQLVIDKYDNIEREIEIEIP